MGESSVAHDSVSDSTHSRSSGDGLIAKSPQTKSKGFDFKIRDRKHSRKNRDRYDFFDNSGTEEQKDTFKWIPNPTESILSESVRERNQSYSKTEGIVVSTLESDKTYSSYTTSDFTSNSYTKNGYIRGNNNNNNNEKKENCDSLLKYNEFSSLVSSLGTGSSFPIEVKVDDKDILKKEDKRPRFDDENSVFLITGGIQMMLGILMAVFGVLVIVHDSSLAGAGSGLWGGAVAMLSGLLGVLAGLKGCYSSTKTESKISPALLSAFLALCLVSFALSNLVLVLTATGLIRDVQRPNYVDEGLAPEEDSVNWPPVLADAGLILASALQCVLAVMSGYKCYKKVCPCLRRDHSRLSETDSHDEKYKAEGKDRLVNHWLGQQMMVPNKKSKKTESGQIPWGTPSIVLLPPPPPMVTNGQVPILTFLQAPSSILGSSACSQMYNSPAGPPCCCHHDNRYIINHHHQQQVQQPMVHGRRVSRKANYIQPDPKVPAKPRHKRRRERRMSLPTTEEVARTYTGLDREIAEEFIAISMEKKGRRRRSRNNSLSDFKEYTVTSVY